MAEPKPIVKIIDRIASAVILLGFVWFLWSLIRPCIGGC